MISGACSWLPSQVSCFVPVSPGPLRDLVPPFGGWGGILGCPFTRTRGCSSSLWGPSRAWGPVASFLGSLKGAPLPGQLESLWLEWNPERPPLASHSKCTRQPDFCALPLISAPTLPCPSPLPQVHKAGAAGRERQALFSPRSGDRTPEHLGVTGLCPCGQWGEGVLCPPLRPGTESLPCLPGSSHGPSASSARARRSLYLGCQGGRPHPNWVTSTKSHFRMKSGPLALGGQGCSLLVGGTASNPQHPSPFCEMFRPSRLACGILVAKPCCCIERAEC